MTQTQSDSMLASAKDNPYVGPQPFALEKHSLFRGRERETSDLRVPIAAYTSRLGGQ